jgi:hypothetical protein
LVGPDPGHREPRTFTITPLSIRNLQGFLKATGWRCIYGLNLGGGSLDQALAEGGFVARTLGSQLMCVQFGNEPDLFKHRDQGNKPWTCDEYVARWKTFRAAFHEKLPEVAVAGPDTAFNQKWVKQFTQDVPKEIVLATSHYYPEGPPSDPLMTIDLLLHPGARFDSSCREALDTARAAGLPFRMAEGNSCYNAGKPGVSDTFASALWAGDFCLQMASLGCVGVNLHGGANGFYSPIVGSIGSGFVVRPEYYGLMLAQQFMRRTGRARRVWWPCSTRMHATSRLLSPRRRAVSSALRLSASRLRPSTAKAGSRSAQRQWEAMDSFIPTLANRCGPRKGN